MKIEDCAFTILHLLHGDFHYYTKCDSEDTQLYLFGCGLGECAIIQQVALAFVDYVNEYGDPDLGRVSLSFGQGETAYMAWKGNINVHWVTCNTQRDDWMGHYFKHVLIQPDIILAPSSKSVKMIEDAGYRSLKLPFATSSLFKPLGLKREGMGYAGVHRESDQTRIIFDPLMKLYPFEWIAKLQQNALLLPALNRWYNTKQLTFALSGKAAVTWSLITNRVFEVLGSGTPMITSIFHAFEDVFGFKYPYQSDSAELTVEHAEYILGNFDDVLEEFAEYSKIVHRDHTYNARMKRLITELKKL